MTHRPNLDRGLQEEELISVGSNVFINTEGIFFGPNNEAHANSEGWFGPITTDVVDANAGFFNSLWMNGAINFIGDDPDVVIDNTGYFVGNSSVNAVVNSSGFFEDGIKIEFTETNPGGSNTNIQYNDSGVFGGSDAFSFNESSNSVTVGNSTVNSIINSSSITSNNITASSVTANSYHGDTSPNNILINPEGVINQRNVASGSDDTYGHDRWYRLTQTAAISVGTQTNVSDGVPSMMRLTQTQGTAQRMGYAQIVESINCQFLRGKSVTLSGKVRLSSSANIRFAILEWTGTADSVTSDVVNSWTNTTYTAGNFFISSNLTVTAVGSLSLTADVLTDFSLTGTVSSSMNNLIVFIWTEGTAAQNVTLDLRADLRKGNSPGFDRLAIDDLLQACYRYYRKIVARLGNFHGEWGNETAGSVMLWFYSPMRVAPTVTQDGTLTVGAWFVGTRTESGMGFVSTTEVIELDFDVSTLTGATGRMAWVEGNNVSCSAEL